MVNLRELTQRPGNSIPGYTGFVPGKKAETIIAGTYARINHECAGRRYPLGEPLITSRSLPGGSRPIRKFYTFTQTVDNFTFLQH